MRVLILVMALLALASPVGAQRPGRQPPTARDAEWLVFNSPVNNRCEEYPGGLANLIQYGLRVTREITDPMTGQVVQATVIFPDGTPMTFYRDRKSVV
jgi:hypothetical protein